MCSSLNKQSENVGICEKIKGSWEATTRRTKISKGNLKPQYRFCQYRCDTDTDLVFIDTFGSIRLPLLWFTPLLSFCRGCWTNHLTTPEQNANGCANQVSDNSLIRKHVSKSCRIPGLGRTGREEERKWSLSLSVCSSGLLGVFLLRCLSARVCQFVTPAWQCGSAASCTLD